ncbi:hypothetical protein [Paenibacillus sp. J2TS4]|uniref:hypothetical protein n=1 Tax=Paenibacillus sp. J2TS4 TaxID=2807194 RepID=UPI001B16C6AC|nr:hypothetical protein [Paenibacillus sp. J2TS4]GIP33505.1 hypothetical protein J2TS4_27150 [Paenibacillus sp. J2TS4]
MEGILEGIKILSALPAITAIIGIIKFFNRVLNRNELENHVTEYDKKTWESFGEVLIICILLVLGVNVPVLLLDTNNPLFSKLAGILFFISFPVLIITTVTTGLISLYFNIVKFFKKEFLNNLMHVIIPKIPYPLLFSLMLTNVSYSILHLPEKVTSDFLVGYITVIYIIYTALILLSINTLKYIAKPSIAAVKVEAIHDALIEKVLTKLCFIYALDNERHVMSHVTVKKNELVLPAYIYYPKENRLIKYYREESWFGGSKSI